MYVSTGDISEHKCMSFITNKEINSTVSIDNYEMNLHANISCQLKQMRRIEQIPHTTKLKISTEATMRVRDTWLRSGVILPLPTNILSLSEQLKLITLSKMT